MCRPCSSLQSLNKAGTYLFSSKDHSYHASEELWIHFGVDDPRMGA